MQHLHPIIRIGHNLSGAIFIKLISTGLLIEDVGCLDVLVFKHAERAFVTISCRLVARDRILLVEFEIVKLLVATLLVDTALQFKGLKKLRLTISRVLLEVGRMMVPYGSLNCFGIACYS